jgi:hypothetical protein
MSAGFFVSRRERDITVVQGFTRFRKIQVGKQSVIATAVPATRVLPYRGLIEYNPNRTDPDVDVGSLDPILAPYPLAPEVTISGATGPLDYDNLAIRMSAGIKGGVSPTGPTGGTAYTWTFTAASLTADSFDYYSVQTGDDSSDANGAGSNGFGGVIDTLSEEMGEDLAPWTVSDDWVFANATYGNRTGSLTIAANPAWVFGADTAIYLDSNALAIGVTPLAAAVRGATLRVSNNLDQKRFADGSNTRFNLQAFGRGPREIEFTMTVEKTTATIAEVATLDDTPVPNRYIKIASSSTELAGTALPYSSNTFLPVRLMSVSDGEIGGNANWTLTYKGFYDSTLAYAYKRIIVNKLSALP